MGEHRRLLRRPTVRRLNRCARRIQARLLVHLLKYEKCSEIIRIVQLRMVEQQESQERRFDSMHEKEGSSWVHHHSGRPKGAM